MWSPLRKTKSVVTTSPTTTATRTTTTNRSRRLGLSALRRSIRSLFRRRKPERRPPIRPACAAVVKATTSHPPDLPRPDFRQAFQEKMDGSSRRGYSRNIRFSFRTETIRYREIMNDHIRDFLWKNGCRDSNSNACLNGKGVCQIVCGSCAVVVEVPKDSQCFFLYSLVYRPTGFEGDEQMYKLVEKALELNYSTTGATLSLDEDEFLLSTASPIDGMTSDEFSETVQKFMVLTRELSAELSCIASEVSEDTWTSVDDSERKNEKEQPHSLSRRSFLGKSKSLNFRFLLITTKAKRCLGRRESI